MNYQKELRVRGIRLSWFAVTLLSVSAASAATPEKELAPSTPWRITLAKDQCNLERTFGTGDDAIVLGLVQNGGPSQLDVVFYGKAAPKLKSFSAVELRLSPQGDVRTYSGLSFDPPGRPERLVRLSDTGLGLFKASPRDQGLSISTGTGFRVTLLKAAFPPALKALDSCYDQLLTSWGVDPKNSNRLAVPPSRIGEPNHTNPGTIAAVLLRGPVAVGSGSSFAPPKFSAKELARAAMASKVYGDWGEDAWLTPNDYPSDALRKEKAGKVVVVLSVNADGRVANCRVVSSSGFAPLDTATCTKISERARYAPARDQNNNTVPSTIIERVVWVIPPP